MLLAKATSSRRRLMRSNEVRPQQDSCSIGRKSASERYSTTRRSMLRRSSTVSRRNSQPAEKPLFLHALAMREYLESGHVDVLWWLDTLAMLADGMTKGSVEREALIRVCAEGIWKIVGQTPVSKQLRGGS